MRRWLARLIWAAIFVTAVKWIIEAPTIGIKLIIFFLSIPVFFGWTKGWRKAEAEVDDRFPLGKRMLFSVAAVIVILIVMAIVFRAK